ncbi:hypothetical protein DM860_017300 [Cuscuta australis]|uniref:Josephin-like protein n=1 Tax=Cuscuta australis TaxID=267555 RepID=A0A328E6S2_9ASTE|nr:hypothetical protein DM860_017300 [Cuscuta australis]
MISRVIFIRPWEGKNYKNPKKVGKNKEKKRKKKKKKAFRVWGFKFPQKSSSLTSIWKAAKFVKQLGGKVSKAFSRPKGKRSSRKISSVSFARSRSYTAETLLAADSQRAEAIEDCIEFLNSCSSSLPRSSSVSSSVNYY